MKNQGGKFYVVIAFLAISLFVANTLILNLDLKGGFASHMSKSILNYAKNENTFEVENTKNVHIPLNDDDDAHEESSPVESDKNRVSSDDEREIQDGDVAQTTGSVANGASGKVVIEQSSRRVLFGEREHEKCYPASTTKILTAYITLKNLPLDHVVRVPRQAAGVEGSSIYLKEGEQITVEDLLFGLMLRSGNDAATALALEVAGSVEAFADMMNETAKALGAKNSHFVNPHGLHDDEHFTTAYDLAIIAAAAYELDDFRRIACSGLAKIEIDGVSNSIANKNKLLKLYEGANGVKTGYTKKSGRCLVGGAKRDNMQLISVTLNCPDMWNETVKLLDYGFENYRMIPLDNALLTYGEGKKRVAIVAPYSVTSDHRDIYYPLARDEYLEVNAA